MHLALLLASLVPLAAEAPAVRHGKSPDSGTLKLTFGVYQTDKATVMYRQFAPVLERIQEGLEKRVERPVDIHLQIHKSYDDAIDALVAGEVDFVRFGPASYVLAKHRNPRIELLAMEHEDGQKRFKGVIVVRADSAIRQVADLRGKSFAFGDPNSTIGRYLVQAELARGGIHARDLAHYAYLERHDKVARAVQVGEFDAGAVKPETLAKVDADGQLRVLATFDNVTKPWASRAELDPAVFRALQATLCALDDPAVLKQLSVTGLIVAGDEEYDFVREGMKQAVAFESNPSGS
jgi:phosphonate transport system substrate-binding protein